MKLPTLADLHAAAGAPVPSLHVLEVFQKDATEPTLQPQSALRTLQDLGLIGLPVRGLGPLSICIQLQVLEVDLGPAGAVGSGVLSYQGSGAAGAVHRTALSPSPTSVRCGTSTLGACFALQHLDFGGSSRITSLEPLELCIKLSHLDLSHSLAFGFDALSLPYPLWGCSI